MSAQNNIPVEIRGYVTDHKLVGYQILTNYESTYWRCLVGREAWALYEVLRSFTREDNEICNPSLRTLMDILGLTDRRQLIGRVDSKPGKERELPGLIDILQEQKIAFAELKGEGPKLRYLFHVKRQLPALTPDQVKQLPDSLQKKHAQLLQRVAQSVQEITDIETKVSLKPKKTLSSELQSPGGGTVPPPPGTVPPPPGTVPPKQQQVNNTHITTTSKADLENNNSSGEPDNKHDVVVALTNKGISKKVAQRLAHRYSRKRILEKIEYLEYLQETDPQKVTNPRGWLRRAIEDDYGKPDGFKSRAEREAEAAAAEKRRQSLKEYEIKQQAEEEQKRQKAQKAREEKLTAVKAQYNTTPETEALWSSWLSHIRATDSPGAALLQSGCKLLAVQGHEVVLWVDNPIFLKTVQRNYAKTIRQLAARHLKISFTEVELTPVIAAKNSEDTDP